MRGWLKALCLSLGLCGLTGEIAAAQGHFSGLARADARGSSLHVDEGVAYLNLSLSQPVPWRIRYLADPPRLVADFREVDFRALDFAKLLQGPGVTGFGSLRGGAVADGWSRLVLALDRPRLARLAELKTGQGDGTRALLRLELAEADEASFRLEAARRDPPGWALPVAADLAKPRAPRGSGPLVIMLDPGHGGLDPGAEYGGQTEAGLMLIFARELKEALLRNGFSDVRLTRERDVFVPLETRIALAHGAGADVFISLHADAVTEGVARGATIYTMAAEASDAASAALAERHDRDALMSGVDLTGQDDLIAGILMDMARVETAPRAAKLSEDLVQAMSESGIALHRIPRRSAAFSVLKAPDIPSVLIELGYLSSAGDLQRLNDPKWRANMAGAIVTGLQRWSVRDAAQGVLLRQ